MFAAFKKLFSTTVSGSNNDGGNRSKSLAKSRLSFVLVQDRTGLTSEEMAKFKKELVGVIEKYFEIDENAFDIAYKRETESTTLLINSPVVVRRVRRRGIDAKVEAVSTTTNGSAASDDRLASQTEAETAAPRV